MTENMTDKQAMTALKQHAGNIVLAIVLALAAFFGWQYYQDNYAKIDMVAADLYTVINSQHEELVLAAQNPDVAGNTEITKATEQLYKDIDTLVAEHGNTVYAWQALMIKARHQADNGDVDGALASLGLANQVKIDDAGLLAISKLQQAQLLLDKGDIEMATSIANEPMPESFEASRQEVLGDIYVAKQETDNAKAAYDKAWQLLSARQENRALLSLKMQALGMTVEPIAPKYQVVQAASTPAQTVENTDTVPVDTVEVNAVEVQSDSATAGDTIADETNKAQ